MKVFVRPTELMEDKAQAVQPAALVCFLVPG